jgi:hypothetical protein
MALSIRERPPLRVSIDVIAPSGRRARWAADEARPENVFSGLRWSSTMPGGWESLDCKLPRKPGLAYADLEELSKLSVYGVGGRTAGEFRLERTPRSSGQNDLSVSPSAVGYIAALEDNKAVREIYVDCDLSKWRGPSVAERIARVSTGTYSPGDPSTQPDPSGSPSVALEQNGPWAVAAQPLIEAIYEAPAGVNLGRLYYAWQKNAKINAADTNWRWDTILSATDVGGSGDNSGNLRAAGPGSGTLVATAAARYALARLFYDAAPAGGNNFVYGIYWFLAVYGDHGLDLYGTADQSHAQGVLASDVVKHAVGKWAPEIDVNGGTIDPSSFVIPQLAFTDPTTAAEIVRQATRFELQDWAVWDGPTMHLHDRGTTGRRWRARAAVSGLSETGPQVDRLWNSIVVAYNDVDGSTRTVGPPGSGCDVEDERLADPDPLNPANELGITRRDMLVIGTSVAAAAVQVGARFLEESKLLDTSGQANIVGHVQDDRGVWHPYWAMRAGDSISFPDAADPSYRRITRAESTDDSKTCQIDLDAPPEGQQQLLERLGASLVPLGLS